MHAHDDIHPDWLENTPGEVALPDGGFSALTLQRIDRYRRRRRHVFMLVSAAAAAAVASVTLTFAPALPVDALAEPWTLASALLLTALCGLVWISTESSFG